MCLYLMRDIVSPLSGFGSPFGRRRRDTLASVIASIFRDSEGLTTPLTLDQYFKDLAGDEVSENTDPIALAMDPSGNENNLTQTSATFRPTLNAGDMLYDGGDDRLVSPYVSGTSGSLFARFNGATASRVLLGAQPATNGRAFLGLDASGRIAAGIGEQATGVIRDQEADRRNLLDHTEDFGNAYWGKFNGGSIDSNVTTAPNGDQSADRWNVANNALPQVQGIVSISGNTAGRKITASVFARSASGTPFRIRLQEIGGSAGGTQFVGLSFTPGPGWARYEVTGTIGAADRTSVRINFDGDNEAGEVLLWGAQLEESSEATGYQRVGNEFDVTEAGVPSLRYLSFDGVDDSFVTPTITPGVDKVQVFAGVRKLSDAATGLVVETGTFSSANEFTLRYPRSGSQSEAVFGTRDTGVRLAAGTAHASPATSVLVGISDRDATTNTLRRNGVQESTTSSGTAENFAARALGIGANTSGGNPFNGYIYSLITRFGPNLDATTIERTESYVAKRTGVQL